MAGDCRDKPVMRLNLQSDRVIGLQVDGDVIVSSGVRTGSIT